MAGWEENGEIGLGSKDGFGFGLTLKLPGSLWERSAMGVNLPETQCLRISRPCLWLWRGAGGGAKPGMGFQGDWGGWAL